MEDKTTHISITSGTIFRVILIVLMFVALFIVRDIVLVVLTGVVIASAIEPATKWLVRKKVPRIAAVIFIYLAVVSGVAGIFYAVLPPVLKEAVGILNNLPESIKVADLWSPLSKVATVLHVPESIPVSALVNETSGVLSEFSGGLFDTASNFLGGIVSLILIIVVSFYLSVQENGVEHFLRLITPARSEEKIISLWKRTQIKIGLWMQGQIILQLIVGLLIYLGLLILQIPHALILSVLAFVFELIPVFGVILAVVPAFIFGTIDGGLTTGFLVIGLYLIVQQFESHLIYPLVVNKVVGIPPLLVIISLIIGAKLAGFLGIILSVPFSVALVEYLDDLDKIKTQARHNLTL